MLSIGDVCLFEVQCTVHIPVYQPYTTAWLTWWLLPNLESSLHVMTSSIVYHGLCVLAMAAANQSSSLPTGTSRIRLERSIEYRRSPDCIKNTWNSLFGDTDDFLGACLKVCNKRSSALLIAGCHGAPVKSVISRSLYHLWNSSERKSMHYL